MKIMPLKKFDKNCLKLCLCTNASKYGVEKTLLILKNALKAGVTLVQIREKNLSDRELYNFIIKAKKICNKYNAPIIINDRIDMALATNVDGVHLGQDDLPVYVARKILGPDKIIGLTISKVEQLNDDVSSVDYIGVGAIFKSVTKPEAAVVGLKGLKDIRECTNLPIIVIGGINFKTISEFINININGFAMIREIFESSHPYKTIKNLIRIIDEVL